MAITDPGVAAEDAPARALVQLYKDLSEERVGWAQRIRATLFHQGVPSLERVLNATGRALLPGVELSPAGHRAVDVGLRQIERLSAEIKVLGKEIRERAQVPRAGRGALRGGPDSGLRHLGGDGRSQTLLLVL
jgi:hypothetical protein